MQTSSAATLTVTTAPSGGLNLTELTPGLAPPAAFNTPSGIVIDGAGVVYVADSSSNSIRRLTTDGIVSTVAGGSASTSGADGTGVSASFNHPRGIAIAADGTLYVTDSLNHTVRKIAAGGVVTTLAGVAGTAGATDGSGAAARFNTPFGITVGSDGALYVADSMNFTIRRVTTAGVVTTIAGTAGSAGTTDGSGAAARFGLPAGIVADGTGALYVSDQENNTVRKVTQAGATTTLAGNGSTTALDAVGTAAGLPHPSGMAFSNGDLYLTAVSEAAIGGDLGQVRKIVLADASVHTLAGVGTHAAAPATPQADGPAASAKFIFEH
jgi:sugar lactone lactonase YvrE